MTAVRRGSLKGRGSTWFVALAVGASMSPLTPVPASAADSAHEPTSWNVQRALGRELDRTSAVRVTGTFGSAELNRPSLEPDGLHYLRGRLLEAGAREPLPRVIQLSQITAMWAGLRAPGYGAGAGAVLGMLVGIAVAHQATGGDTSRLNGAVGMAVILGSTAIGFAGGAMVGVTVRRWERIYPRSAPPP